MTTRPWVLAETTWATVREAGYEVAVLPWGATEAHNYHLPYATDNIQCDRLAAEAASRAWARGARVVVLPCMPFGVQTTQLDIPYTLNLMPSTQALVLRDLAQALHGQGVKKLVVFNGHGGNDFKQMIRELGASCPLFVSQVDWWRVLDGSRYFEKGGDHAGELETCVMMHVAPELVAPLETAGDGHERRYKVRALKERWAWAPRAWTKVTKDTGIGDPRLATAEKGARYVDDLCTMLADYFVELAAADLNDMYE